MGKRDFKDGVSPVEKRIKKLEAQISEFVHTEKTVCLNSATAAEELNLRILGVREGDEVIVPAYTYTASASAAIHCGATVKFVDIQQNGDKETHAPEMDYEKLEEAITEKTKVVEAKIKLKVHWLKDNPPSTQ